MRLYEEYRGISDIIHGASNGSVFLGFGHNAPGYWQRNAALEKETFAQFGRILYEQDEDVLRMAKDVFGKTYTELIERMRGMIK